MSFSLSASVLAGRYQLEERIAAGGMGEVWRGLDLVLDRPVAVKLLRAEYADNPETLARFRAEARHAGGLSHPGIAQVYDYGEAGPGQPPFLVMELVDGPPLTRLLARGPMDPAQTLDVVEQAAAALSAAHAAGLVHRDIKPGNLLIGPGGTVKITDFGIAYAADSAPLTRTGALVGTPAYLAPERVSGGTAAPASDLYSLGIVAYECLAGSPPFTGMSLEVALAHQGRPLPPLPPTVPRPVAALVSELTTKDPAKRPASAGQVAARAQRIRAELSGGGPTLIDPALDSPPGLPAGLAAADARPASPASGAWPATLAGPSADTLADVGIGPLGGAEAYDSGWPPPPRQDTGWGRRPVLLAVAAVAVLAGLVGWLLAGAAGPQPAPRHPASRPHVSTAAGRTVVVNGTALVGQRFGVVTQRLHQLGLSFHLTWQPTDHPDPGTVLSVKPSGRVPVGSMIFVTVAAKPPGHGHGHGGGDGNGNGNGNGNGGGD